MGRIVWDQPGSRRYEAGIDRGVLYPPGAPGVAWNGLTSVVEDRGSANSTAYYQDGVKYYDTPPTSDFKATLSAFTYPDEFLPFDGVADVGQGVFIDGQVPLTFGLSYRTKVGTDTNGSDHGYKIHMLHQVTAVPTNNTYKTLGLRVDPIEFSWSISGIPEPTPGFRPSAHVILDSTRADYRFLGMIEDILYGKDDVAPELPTFADLIDISLGWAPIYLTDNSDGTWTATTDYDDAITDVNATTFRLEDVDVTTIDANTYQITEDTA